MERRQNERNPINQAAVVIVDGRPLLNWRISNFSHGGLFLAPIRRGPQQDYNELVAEITREQVRIELPQPYTGKKAPVAAEAQVRYRCAAGIGVSFVDPNNGVLQFLADKLKLMKPAWHSSAENGSSQSEARITPSECKTVLNRLGQMGERYVHKYYGEFEPQVQTRLLQASDAAKSDVEQKDLFYALTTLGKEDAVIKRKFFAAFKQAQNALSAHANGPESKDQPEPPLEKLGLVAKEDFDEWALVVGIARTAETNTFSRLFTLEKCLAYITKASINSETDPYSPHSLLDNYRTALSSYDLSIKSKEIIYTAFKDLVLSPIGALYDELNAYLEDRGIVKQTPVYGVKPKPSKPASASAEEPEQPPPGRKRKKRGAVETLASLMGVRRPAVQATEEEQEPIPTASNEEILDTLAQLPPSTIRSLADRVESELLRNAAPGQIIQLPVQTRESIAVTERLVDTLQHNATFSSEMRRFIGNLQIPLVKEVINDSALITDPNHPGRRLLEALGALAPYLSGVEEKEPGKDVLSQIIEHFGEQDFLSGNVDLDEVTDKLEELINQHKSDYDDNLALVLESCKEEESYQHAKETILALLTRKVTQGSVPLLVERVLRLGWVGLLANTIFNKGTKSQEWRVFAGLIDIFLKQFSEDKSNEPIPERKIFSLITVLRKGFDRYPVHLEAAKRFIADLEGALQDSGDKFAGYITQRTTISKDDLKTMMRDQMPNVADGAPAETVEESWLEMVQNIKVDDWIVEQREPGQVRLINLAWKSPFTSRLVFVDGKGEKALDIEASALAHLFAQKQYSLLEDKELPLVERTVSNLLENTLEKLKRESDRDPLTGLYSRKALQRKVSSLIKTARSDGAQHVLIFLDIDRFEVVNDTCGFDGGDRLLETIANLIKTYLTRDAFVARTGDDEFVTLVERCSLDEGFQIAEIQRRALVNLKFQWQGMNATSTASIGIVPIDAASTNTTDLMNCAASACNLAKQEGGNSSRVYQASHQDFERRERMQKSLPIFEQALEKNQLAIFSQLIKPVFLAEEDRTYHEMLLRFKDEKGIPGSAEEFIQAAEQYNRMRSVDRWVVDTVFSWLDHHHEKLDKHDCFSINLSAQSVTDDSFAEYLLEKIDASSFPNERLAFEITETALATQINKAQKLLTAIRDKGCKVFLDDFGSGYASYSYLKELPTDVVKIDGMFIRDMLTDSNSHAMVKSIIEIAHFMNKQVIAEYVQDEATIIALTELEVDYVQGFGVGRPSDLKSLIRVAA